MSDPSLDLLRRVTRLERTLENVRTADVPGIRLPYAQRALNPMAATTAFCDFPQARAVSLLAFSVAVFVVGTNSGAAYWTIKIQDTGGTQLASVDTSAIGPNVWTRLAAASLTQPGSSNVAMTVIATATGAPGNIFIVPEVVVA